MIADREASPPRLTVFLCFLGAICEGFDIQAAGVAAGGLIRVFRPTPHALGLFFSASGLGLLLGALVGGRVSDLMGRKPVLVASISAFGIFSFLTSLAPDMNSLIAARFLTGLGLGGAMPNLIALAADSSTSKSRTANIAAAYVGMPFGGVAASLVIFLIPLDAWRLVFQIGGAAPLIIVPLMIWLLPRPKPAALKVAAGAWVAPNMARALFGNGRAPRTLLLWMSFFLIVLTLHLMLNWLPLLLTGRGLLKGQAAIAQAGFNAGGGLLALLLGVVLDSRWRRIAVAVSMVMLPAMLVSAERFWRSRSSSLRPPAPVIRWPTEEPAWGLQWPPAGLAPSSDRFSPRPSSRPVRVHRECSSGSCPSSSSAVSPPAFSDGGISSRIRHSRLHLLPCPTIHISHGVQSCRCR
jgi:MFS transporter, AAHS family, 3-hydroxyphenylpropionic acid transporter